MTGTSVHRTSAGKHGSNVDCSRDGSISRTSSRAEVQGRCSPDLHLASATEKIGCLFTCLQARRDNASMVKGLGWLSASEAEASTLSRGLKAQVR